MTTTTVKSNPGLASTINVPIDLLPSVKAESLQVALLLIAATTRDVFNAPTMDGNLMARAPVLVSHNNNNPKKLLLPKNPL